MFGRDPITAVAKLLEPKPRYYGEKSSLLKMGTLRRLYTVVIENICKAREKKPQPDKKKPHNFKVNDMVLVKDPESAVFEPKYQPNYRVTVIFGDNRNQVQDEKGHISVCRSSHVKYVEPSEKAIQQLPNKELLQKYGRSSKLLIVRKDILDLQFKLVEQEGSNKVREELENQVEGTKEVVEVMECEVLNSKTHNSSENLLKRVVDIATRRGDRSEVWNTSGMTLQTSFSEN